MIVPMKKVFAVALKRDVLSVAQDLGQLGIVHVEHQEPLEGYELEGIREEVDILESSIEILKSTKIHTSQESCVDWTDTTNDISKLTADIEGYKEHIAKRQALINQWQSWGNFDPRIIKDLEEKGLYVWLCEIPLSQRSQIPSEVIVEEISAGKGSTRCVLIARQRIDLPFPIIPPPTTSLSQMAVSDEADKKRIEEAREKINSYARYLQCFEGILKEQRRTLALEEVASGMKEEGTLAVLKGFCPVDLCPTLEAKAKELHWGLLVQDPGEEDRVPTFIKNPRWVEIIKPLFNVINVLPGYRELDISFIFLIFFSIFFGILIGDAGYGLIFISLTLFLHFKFREKIKDKAPFFLMYALSTCAIVWGVLTGTFLGTVLFKESVKPLLGWLTETKNVQLFCFIIAAIHLTIAHFWRFLMKAPKISALAELGWILILWSAFFVANMLILGFPLLGFVKYLFLGGILLIAVDILTQPKNTIFVNTILLVFSIISAFTDIVSYIRLFAVGLAGVAVADAFNEMALGFGFHNFFTSFITILILVVGHIFNIALSGFGILVHGLRLNVLEFSGHLGLEWAGVKYEPFKTTESILKTS